MVNRLVLGAMEGSFKLKISKPGYDVLTATDNKQLAFSSDWNEAGNIIATGNVSLDGTGKATVAFPQFTDKLTVLASCFHGGRWRPLNVLSNPFTSQTYTGHEVDLYSFTNSFIFQMQGAGGGLVSYVVMENQFG